MTTSAPSPSSNLTMTANNFFQGVSRGFSDLATTISQKAEEVKVAVEKSYQDMIDFPTEVRCSGCDKLLPLPATIWEWSCPRCTFVNSKTNEICSMCEQARPQRGAGLSSHPVKIVPANETITEESVTVSEKTEADSGSSSPAKPNAGDVSHVKLPQPTVECLSCRVITSVPSTKVSNSLNNTSKEVKTWFVSTTETTKKKVQELASPPSATFNCGECGILLGVPNWPCEGCTFDNKPENVTCGMCQRPRPNPLRVNCAICGRVTKIPSTNFENDLVTGARGLTDTIKKTYFDVLGKPYSVCSRCNAPLPVSGSSAAKPEDASVPTGIVIHCARCSQDVRI